MSLCTSLLDQKPNRVKTYFKIFQYLWLFLRCCPCSENSEIIEVCFFTWQKWPVRWMVYCISGSLKIASVCFTALHMPQWYPELPTIFFSTNSHLSPAWLWQVSGCMAALAIHSSTCELTQRWHLSFQQESQVEMCRWVLLTILAC